MRVGISCFLTDHSIGVVDLAREAEARGFDDLWVPEHTHIPTGRETAWPMREGAELPEKYARSLDPFVSLAAAAVATSDIRLGTSICLVAQHDPIVLAKTVTTLDHLSGGRVTLGVGFGWNEDEMRHHGVDPRRRRTIGREKVLAMKELWTQEEASFHGTYVDFSPSWQWPKPVQRPHPPVWVGGGKSTIKHAVEWGDGWMPIEGVMPVATLVGMLRADAEAAGRDPERFPVYLAAASTEPARLAEYGELGLEGISLGVAWNAGLDSVRRQLDDHAELRQRYLES